jgi:hypothetical protein
MTLSNESLHTLAEKAAALRQKWLALESISLLACSLNAALQNLGSTNGHLNKAKTSIDTAISAMPDFGQLCNCREQLVTTREAFEDHYYQLARICDFICDWLKEEMKSLESPTNAATPSASSPPKPCETTANNDDSSSPKIATPLGLLATSLSALAGDSTPSRSCKRPSPTNTGE